MLFNSVQFLLFFIVVTLAYYNLRWQGRWALLLIASCYFYMVFEPIYILILFLTIVIDYFAGLWIADAAGAKRKWLLLISIITNVGILAIFKYFDFLAETFNNIFFKIGFGLSIPRLDGLLPASWAAYIASSGRVLLPIGLSFHTFQAMSYTIEVYRGNQKAEKHFGIYALYVMFYPQLVAGPIERPQNVLHQFHENHAYDWENVKQGLMRMAFGMFKKVVIADRLTMMAGYAYENPSQYGGMTLLLATFFYSFTIYCDFSGYSDIAIGSAKVMGFKLMENFNTPYFSKSIAEFWGRWHISLSSWFRDYLYIPLGGNRKGEVRKNINQMIVFLTSGLWHGASWNFIIWGGLHGMYLVSASWRDMILKKLNVKFPTHPLYQYLQVAITFLLVTFTWVFFAVGDVPSMTVGQEVRRSFEILHKMLTFAPPTAITSKLNTTEMWLCVILILGLMLKERYVLHIPTRKDTVFWSVFLVLIVVIYFLGVFNAKQFIYFQF